MPDESSWLQTAAGASTQATSYVLDTPEAHGAKRDGRRIIDAAMPNAGSGVVTSPSSPWSSADVNKVFMINRAGSGGVGQVLLATVQSYQGPGQITLDTPAVRAVAGQIAVWGTDDTAAIYAAEANAVATAQANWTNLAKVAFSSGIYMVAGAPQTSQHGSAQIPLVYVPPAAPKLELQLIGPGDNTGLIHWSQSYPQMSGAVIVSAARPAYSATYGIPSVIGGPTNEQGYGGANNAIFSNIIPVISGLTVVQPLDPTGHGIDFSCCAEMLVDSLACFSLGSVAGNLWWSGLVPTAGFVYSSNWMVCGLVMPGLGNNDNCRINSYTAEGIMGGLALGEHADCGSIRVLSCDTGITITQNAGMGGNPDHAMNIQGLSTENCRNHIYIPGGTIALNILSWDPEDTNGLTNRLIYDNGGSSLRGRINVNTQMLQNGLTRFGATAAEIIDISRAVGPAGPPAVPAANASLTNPYLRHGMVKVNANGTGVVVTIDGVQRTIGNWEPISSVGTISLGNYTVAPTWQWYLT